MKVDALGGKKQTIDKMDNGKWDNVQEIERFFQLSTAKSLVLRSLSVLFTRVTIQNRVLVQPINGRVPLSTNKFLLYPKDIDVGSYANF